MFTCPDPTPEQKALGEKLGYDPYDRCGDGALDTSPCDPLCAACLIHDELFLVGGTYWQWQEVNRNFERDVFILAKAIDDIDDQMAATVAAELYVADVWAFSYIFWRSVDRNTPTTRTQGQRAMGKAFSWINECAKKIGQEPVYPEIKFVGE